MGHKSRQKPKKLAEKLTRIRNELGVSQNGMIRKLGLTDELGQSHISMFEHGEREPTLIVLLRYARVAGVSTDILIDDELDLPKRLPNRIQARGKKKRADDL
jgi:transcriptional regulator with XRE-family HTH domain